MRGPHLPLPLPTLSGLDRALRWGVRRPTASLLLLCAVLWLPGLFSLPPGDRDESRFAQATKQMLETGDYVRIQNGPVARNQKPIGIYWLQLPFAGAAHALGIAQKNPIWPYRLPSLLGGIVAVLATYRSGRRLVGAPAAWLGAAFLAASAILTIEVHIAKTDAALLGATTIAMGVLSRAWLDPQAVRRRTALLFWAALGIGVLLKGPVAPMVVGLAALWLAATNFRSGPPRWLLALRPVPGVAVLAAIVLPWFIAIELATHGGFLAQSVGHDLAGKLAGSDDAHGAPFGLHLLLLPLLGGGGGIAAIAAAPALWSDRRHQATRLLTAWIVPSWLVFEIVATKLPHYTMPLYPALALLGARWMLQPPARRPHRAAATIAAVVVALLGAAGLVLPAIVTPGLHPLDLLGVPVAVVCALLLVALRRVWPDARRAALVLLCGAPFLYGTILGLELPLLSPLWIAPRLQSALASHWPAGHPADAAFGALGYAEPSTMFLCGTGTAQFARPAPAVAFLAGGPDRVLAVDDRDLPAFTQAAEVLQVVPIPFGVVDGYNYSRGRRVRLTLYTLRPGQG